jgi:sigma-B regulation protein RsbU (phosphoserine phosphatase)
VTEQKLKEFKVSLSRHHDELLKLIETKSIGKPFQLQGATVKDILKAVSQFKDALEQIDKGIFGQCALCDEGVEVERLCKDFTTAVCLAHYSDQEIRELEKDLELTAEFQRKLLPCCTPCIKTLQFAHISIPAGVIGGDYYDFFTLAEGKQGIIIADVMGKGLPAGMLMANLQAALKLLGPQYGALCELANQLNKFFRNNINVMSFISLCLICLDIENGILEYCNAGHHPPLFRDDDQNKIHWLKPTGPAIGILQDENYKTHKLDIASNDLLLLYTDGLVEARNEQGTEFGDERLYEFVKGNYQKSAQEFLDELLKSVKSHAHKLHDDLTMMVVKV